jgi:hypothetical protein
MTADATVNDIDFSGESFILQSAFFGTDYALKTPAGKTLLSVRRAFFDATVEYAYRDETETERFRYERSGDDPSSYAFVDSHSDETLVVLTPSVDDPRYWNVVDGRSGASVATIEAELSGLPFIRSRTGRRMTVTAPDGETIGTIRRRLLAFRFTFDVEITSVAPSVRAAIVLAVPLIYDKQ